MIERIVYLDLLFIELYGRLRFDKVKVGRDLSMLEDKYGFQQTGNARCSLKVAYVGFDRTDIKVICPTRVFAEDLGYRRYFLAVACLCSLFFLSAGFFLELLKR